jgi:hypothetical protein
MKIYTSMLFKKLIGCASLCLYFTSTGFSQSIELHNLKSYVKKEAIFDYTGSVSANAVYTGGSGINQQPFTWMLGLNTNLSFFKLINVPLSFSYTNLGGGYTLPQTPNRISISPSYKWISSNIGVVNVSWSPYSVNGHQFIGANVDMTPENSPFTISVLGGRFIKAINYDSTNTVFNGASYKRMGGGAKVNYTKEKYNLGVSIFTAKDDPNSITIFPKNAKTAPGQNLVATYLFGFTPANGLNINGELATNFLTSDINDNTEGDNSKSRLVDNVFNVKNSTTSTMAGKVGLTYNVKKPNATIGIQYERVDPNYLTYGSYFMVNDMENYTLNITQMLFKNKLTLVLNGGRQRDDLKNNKSAKNSRTVGSANISFAPNARLNTSLSYSNFTSFMFVKPAEQIFSPYPIYQTSDTANFKQVNENANFNANYLVKDNENISGSLTSSLSYQNANNMIGEVKQADAASQFYNAIFSYNHVWKKRGLSGGLTYTYNVLKLKSGENITQGPTLFVSKTLKKTINLGYGLSYIALDVPNAANSNVLNNRLSVSYTQNKFSTQLSIVNQNRSGATKSHDLLGNIAFAYQIK